MESRLGRARSLGARAVLGVVAGFAAAAGVILIASPIAGLKPYWLSEVFVSVLAATAWMSVGLRLAKPDYSILGSVLFVLGAATARLLTRGIVHSTSPYYGLLPFGLACLAASTVWALYQRRERSRRARAIAVLLPVTMIAGVVSNALLRPPLSTTRRVVAADSLDRYLPVAPMRAGSWQDWYLWSDRELPIGAESIVQIELDPGSGAGTYRLIETRDSEHVRAACSAFRTRAEDRIRSEISEELTPAFMTVLPIRYPRCENGRIWMAQRWSAAPGRGAMLTLL